MLTMPARPPQHLPGLTLSAQKPSTPCMLQAPDPHRPGLLGTPLEIQSLTHPQVSAASLTLTGMRREEFLQQKSPSHLS